MIKICYRTILLTMVLVNITNPALAAIDYSQSQCRQIAENIVLGQRSPLSNEEIAGINPSTIKQLEQELASARQQYILSYQQGVRDAKAGVSTPPVDEFSCTAYRKGQATVSQPRENNDETKENEKQQPQVEQQQPAPVLPKGELGPLSKDQKLFIKKIAEPAQKVSQKYDLYTSVLIAQAILESNWGRSDLFQQHFNIFGIKGDYQGQGVNLPTVENVEHQDINIVARFRHYPSLLSSIEDYAEVLSQDLYLNVHKSHAASYQKATQQLANVYATDPLYDQKLNKLIQAYNLDRYDNPTQKTMKQPHNLSANHSQKIVAPDRPQKTTKKHRQSHPFIFLLSGILIICLLEAVKHLKKHLHRS